MPAIFDDFCSRIFSSASEIKYQIYASDDEALQRCLKDISEKYLQEAHTVWRVLLEGLKRGIEQELAFRHIRDTGEGRWFVVVTRWEWEDRLNTTGVGEKIEILDFDDKTTAIKIANQLNEKYTGPPGDQTKIEIEIIPEIAYKKGVYPIDDTPS
ncbi:MAG: hypothetical protein JRJ85_15055 [Deltaproteobacteria bacterium]|nr:hypothetical protein [Deltaproteobacteria bacterium]